MRKAIKSIFCLSIIVIIISIIPSVVNANTENNASEEPEMIQALMYNKKGELVELPLPEQSGGCLEILNGNIDYTGYTCKLNSYINFGKSKDIKELGTANFVEKSGEIYVYEVTISNSKFFSNNSGFKSVYFTAEDVETQKTINFEIPFYILTSEKTEIYSKDDRNFVTVYLVANMDKATTLKTTTLEENTEKYKKLSESLKGYSVVSALDITVNNVYETVSGELQLTFQIDTKYNGKEAKIAHQKKDGTIENFVAVVKDGKISINVTELSPFMIAIQEKVADNQQNNNTNNTENNSKHGEKDNTPKTGTINYTLIAGIVLALSVTGLIILKKKQK